MTTRLDTEEPHTMKIKIKGVEVDVPDAAAALYESERKDSADALTAAVKRAEVESARADAAVEAKTAADRARADAVDPKKMDERVNARVALVCDARAVLGSTVKLDGVTDRDVRVRVMAKLSPDTKLDGKSDDYVIARCDGAIEVFGKTNPALAAARGTIEGVDDKGNARADASDEDTEAVARDRMLKTNQEASKRKR